MNDADYLIGIGNNISRIRKDKGLAQQKLAHLCDMDRENLIRIEKGRTNPTALTLRRLSKALKVSVKEFYEGLD